MREYEYSLLLADMPAHSVNAVLTKVAAAVNNGRMRGHIDPSPFYFDLLGGKETEWLKTSEGQAWQESRATPTFRTFSEGVAVFGVAWFRMGDGRRFVRVVGESMQAESVKEIRRFVRPWGLSASEEMAAHAATFVFPDLWLPRCVKERAGVMRGTADILRAQPFDTVTWAVRADWCEEHGFEVERQRCLIAMQLIARLEAHRRGSQLFNEGRQP